jgi:hypothetical protein
MTTPRARTTDRRTMADRRPLVVFAGVFAVGVVLGLIELLTDRNKTSTGASVAVANWVHVGIAVVLLIALAVAYVRARRSLVDFLIRPFTSQGWESLRQGLTNLPRLLVGRRPVRRILQDLAAFVAAVLMLLVALRAGEQVFAALDPDFTRDAWGGPSYLGASLAHWMDGLILFYLFGLLLLRTGRDAA